MQKILHIPNYFPPHIGGIEMTANDIVNSLKGKYEQKVICFSGEKESRVDNIDGVDIYRCGESIKILSQSISFNYKKTLKKLMKEFKPDIVIFHYPNPFVARLLLKYRKCDFKLILYWHMDITKQKFIRKFFEHQNKLLLEYAYKIVSTSPNYIKGSKYLLKYENKVTPIPSCINEKRLKYNDTNLNKANEIKNKYSGKTILFAFGRHVKYKGLEYLIEAKKLLSDKYVLLIGGAGKLTNDLKLKAKDDKNIIFLGKISDDDLKSYFLACDIFCFPSITKNEGFGLGLAEAMYYEKPVVTFTIEGSGVNYVSINNLTGLEVENRNVIKYKDAIEKINNDNNLKEYLAKNAKLRVEENFTYEIYNKRINEFFNNL